MAVSGAAEYSSVVVHTIPSSLRPALEQYAARLRRRFGDRLRSVVLFGSWARGQASEDSDIDVLAVIDRLTPLEAWDAGGEAAPVILASGLPLAPVLMAADRVTELRAAERAFIRAIDREGIPL